MVAACMAAHWPIIITTAIVDASPMRRDEVPTTVEVASTTTTATMDDEDPWQG